MMREITTGPTHGGGDYRAAFFGLGNNDSAYLTVRWPNGVIEEIGIVQADQELHIIEPRPTSGNQQSLEPMKTPHLGDCYPNPFNSRTTIEFSISDSRFVTLKIYDLVGREVAVLVTERLSPGTYIRHWDATGYPSGVYFFILSTTNSVQTKKLVLLR